MKNQFKVTLLLSNVLTTKFTKNWSKAHENNKQKSKIGEALLSVNLSHENVLYACSFSTFSLSRYSNVSSNIVGTENKSRQVE